MDMFDCADYLKGTPLSTTPTSGSVSNSTNAHTITGKATSDSSEGYVYVDMGGDTVASDQSQSIKMATTVSVKNGDTVIINAAGADATGKSPLVIGVVGRGDQQQEEINKTKNYFFHDSDGVHVATTENDATKGPNTLITSDKISIRDGEDELMSIDPNEINLGKNSSSAKINLCDKKIQFTSELANNNTARRTYITGDASLNNNSNIVTGNCSLMIIA